MLGLGISIFFQSPNLCLKVYFNLKKIEYEHGTDDAYTRSHTHTLTHFERTRLIHFLNFSYLYPLLMEQGYEMGLLGLGITLIPTPYYR